MNDVLTPHTAIKLTRLLVLGLFVIVATNNTTATELGGSKTLPGFLDHHTSARVDSLGRYNRKRARGR